MAMDARKFGNALIKKHQEQLLIMAREAAIANEVAQKAAGGEGWIISGTAIFNAILDGYELTIGYFDDDIIERLDLIR